MNARRLNAGLLLLALLLMGGAVLRWWRVMQPDGLAQLSVIAQAPRVRVFIADSVDRAAATTVLNDPFRLANGPSSVSFASTLVAAPPTHAVAPVAAPSRPTLAVRAIIGGPPWSALLDGVPGQAQSTVVNPGTAIGSLRVLSITRDTVVVEGADTTWKITIKRSGT